MLFVFVVALDGKVNECSVNATPELILVSIRRPVCAELRKGTCKGIEVGRWSNYSGVHRPETRDSRGDAAVTLFVPIHQFHIVSHVEVHKESWHEQRLVDTCYLLCVAFV